MMFQVCFTSMRGGFQVSVRNNLFVVSPQLLLLMRCGNGSKKTRPCAGFFWSFEIHRYMKRWIWPEVPCRGPANHPQPRSPRHPTGAWLLANSQARLRQIDLENYGCFGLADPTRTLSSRTHLGHRNRTPWNHQSSKPLQAKAIQRELHGCIF